MLFRSLDMRHWETGKAGLRAKTRKPVDLPPQLRAIALGGRSSGAAVINRLYRLVARKATSADYRHHMTEGTFARLVRGEEVTVPVHGPAGDATVEIALHDIGWERMIELIRFGKSASAPNSPPDL